MGEDFREGVSYDSSKDSLLKTGTEIITYKVPKAASFGSGFYLGWRAYGLGGRENCWFILLNLELLNKNNFILS